MPDGPTFPNDPTLTPLLRERQFLAACIIGLPGLLFAYVELGRAILTGDSPDMVAVTAALSANPIVLYLLARQYARGKASEAVGVQLAPMPAPADPSNLHVTEADLELARDALHGDGFGTAPASVVRAPQED